METASRQDSLLDLEAVEARMKGVGASDEYPREETCPDSTSGLHMFTNQGVGMTRMRNVG